MKIVITGSLGRISKPLTEILIKDGHQIIVVSSSEDRKKEIENLGAVAAIGNLDDASFLTDTFKGADAVYCMVPPANYFDQNLDLNAYTVGIAESFATAITNAKTPRVVFLSSIGAHMSEGNGIIQEHYKAEQILSKLKNVSLTFVRPTSIYYNLYGYMGMVKQGFIAANYGEEEIVWVSPQDIAEAVAEELTVMPEKLNVRYVASDERTGEDTAAVLGNAIGNSDLKWMIVSDEQTEDGMVNAGMNKGVAKGLTEMYSAIKNGKFFEDYYKYKPTLGKVKLEDFAKEFAAAYLS